MMMREDIDERMRRWIQFSRISLYILREDISVIAIYCDDDAESMTVYECSCGERAYLCSCDDTGECWITCWECQRSTEICENEEEAEKSWREHGGRVMHDESD